MKRFTKVSMAIFTALSSAVVAPAFAQDQAGDFGDFYIGAHTGFGWLDSDRNAVYDDVSAPYDGGTDLFIGGVEGGYRFLPNWEMRLYYDYLQGDIASTTRSAYGEGYGADILYSFTPNVYAGLGVNRTDLQGYDHRFLRGTVGYRTFFSKNMAFRVEGALQQSDGNLTEVLTTVGLQYFFGNTRNMNDVKPTPAPARPAQQQTAAPVDSDGDGVNDDKDKCPNTPRNYSVDSEGCVIYENETITETLVVEFDFDSSRIRDGFDGDIQDMAEFMNEHRQLDIVIEGHTDDVGPADYNQWLSERRAKAVGDKLVSDYGVSQNRVKTVGYGESRPRVEGNSAEARQENRRIEAQLSVTNRVPKTD